MNHRQASALLASFAQRQRPHRRALAIATNEMIFCSLQLEWISKCSLDHRFLCLHGRKRVRRSEVIAPRNVYDLRRQMCVPAFKATNVCGAIENVTRFATLHLPVFHPILRQDVVHHGLLDRDAAAVGLLFEDCSVSGRRWRLDARAVTHASQKRLVSEIFLLEVRRKNYELFKRNFDLFSSMQREIVHTSFEWHDPAIQQILRRNSLTTKVVDNECAAI